MIKSELKWHHCHTRAVNGVTLLFVPFSIQDLCILFAAIVVFLLFFNTFIFQAGLVNILVSKFRLPITVVFVYFCLCVGLHVWYMVRISFTTHNIAVFKDLVKQKFMINNMTLKQKVYYCTILFFTCIHCIDIFLH